MATFRFRTTDDRREASAIATAHLIERIGTFNLNRPGASAFRWFTTAAVNCIRSHLRAETSRTRNLTPVDVYTL